MRLALAAIAPLLALAGVLVAVRYLWSVLVAPRKAWKIAVTRRSRLPGCDP